MLKHKYVYNVRRPTFALTEDQCNTSLVTGAHNIAFEYLLSISKLSP